MVHYIIWGKYGSDKLESLICETVNGDYIRTKKQAEAVVNYWKSRTDVYSVRDWRIQRVNLSEQPDFIDTINN